MAQKVTGYIKLQIPAGKATPAPPVGPALGQHGVNIMSFQKNSTKEHRKISVTLSLLLSQYMQTVPSALSQKLHQHQFSSKKNLVLNLLPAYQTKQK